MGDVKTVSIVDIKPASQSKINWTQVASAMAVPVAAWIANRLMLPDEVQVALVVVISWVFNFATIVLKTWFTSTVTAQSAKNTDFVMKGMPLVVASKPE